MIVAVASAAGSAGKTTTVVSLAAHLAATGKRVLVVDADPQATATAWCGAAEGVATLSDVLQRTTQFDAAIRQTPLPNLQVVAPGPALDAVGFALTTTVGGTARLRTALAGVAADVVLIDCPGAIGTLTVAALTAADSVLTVTTPTMKEAAGIAVLEAAVADMDAVNAGLRLVGVVPCSVPQHAGRFYDDVMGLLQETYGDVLAPAVRRSVVVPESHAAGTPLPVHAPAHGATQDYRAVAEWLTARGVF